jgi:hypothetical protein
MTKNALSAATGAGPRFAFTVLVLLVASACSKGANVPATTAVAFESGSCAGCPASVEEDLLSFVVRSGADYELLIANCMTTRIREKWRPPRPNAEEVLVYVSVEGSGCEGCLNIVKVRETSQSIVIDVEGGFVGNCEMLIVPGAWALIPGTEKPISFQFHEVGCPDDSAPKN